MRDYSLNGLVNGQLPTYVTSAYYCPVDRTSIDNTVAPVLNRNVAVPVSFGYGARFTAVSINVATALASQTVTLNVYASLATGLPGARVINGGTTSAATTGVKSWVTNYTFVPGLYWFAFSCSSTTLRITHASSVDADNMIGSFGSPAVGDFAATAATGAYYASSVADPFGSVAGVQKAPVFFVQIST